MAAPRAEEAGDRPRAAAGPALQFVWLELTHACNLRCRHCYACGSKEAGGGSMPLERWLSLLEEIGDAGGAAVQLTGGEPAIRPELVRLLSRARELDLSVELFTNATLLREEDIDLIARLGVDVATSLHSHRPAIHDAITGKKGSHAATLGAIQGLVDKQVELRVATVSMELNAGHAAEVARLCAEMGVLSPHKADPVRPTGRGRGEAAAASGTEGCGGAGESATAMLHPPGTTPPTCWAGKLAITPRGDVIPCIFARDLVVGSVSGMPLSAVLESGRLRELWSLTTDDVEECRGCERKSSCFDCRALPLSVHGDLAAKNPRCTYSPKRPVPSPRCDCPRPRGGMARATLDGDLFLLDPGSARLHRLNAAAGVVLSGLEEGLGRDALASRLADTFSIPIEMAREDVAATIDELLSSDIVAPAGEIDEDADEDEKPVAGETEGEPSSVSSPGAPPSPARLRGDEAVLLDCAGVPVRLEASAEAMRALLPLVRALRAGAGGEAGGSAEVEAAREITVVTTRPAGSARSTHHVFRDGLRVRAARSLGSLLWSIESLLCELAVEGPHPSGDSSLCLHAASLAGENGAVIVSGEHGAGKSTFAAWGAAAGLRYLGDEVARLKRAKLGFEVVGFPKPVKLKPGGTSLVPHALAGALVSPGEAGEREEGFLALEGVRRAQPLIGLFFIERRGAAPEPRRLEPADVVERLLSQSFNIRSLGARQALLEAHSLAGVLPAHIIDTSSLEGAAAALLSWLSSDANRP